MLFAASLAIGNAYSIKVAQGWTEHAILYIALVGKAGVNKSHPISFAMQPLLNHDAAEHYKFKMQYAKYQQLISLTPKERKDQGLTEHKIIVSDITQEGLAYIHEQNKRGICVYVDELKT